MYIHLIISALFPIYTGAHASLSRPSSAAKPDKKDKSKSDDDEDEDEEKVQKMESMSNTDAIVLPITAGVVLAGLYSLIMRYGADIINLIMGYYFSGIGIFSVYKLVNDTLNVLASIFFPTYYSNGGTLWQINTASRKAVPYRGDFGEKADLPIPISSNNIALPAWAKNVFWSVRQSVKQKYTLKAYIHNFLTLTANTTLLDSVSALTALGTIAYVNLVSKPWFLTNLQGFAVSYSALQLMSPTTFATGSLILGSLFCYDVWAVFFTPLMVTVAKNLDVPIKLVFPRPDEPSEVPGEPPVRSYSMLGLGDIVLPGIMIGLALRFDLYMFYLKQQQRRKQSSTANDSTTKEEAVEKAPYVSPTGRWGDKLWTLRLPSSALPPQLRSSFPKPYFTASIMGYVIGMMTTVGVMSVFQHAQPALLYLVPGVLTSLWGTAVVRGELKQMWEFSEAVTGEQVGEEGDGQEKRADDDKKTEQNSKGIFERMWQELWYGDSRDKVKTDAKEAKSRSSSKTGKEKSSDSSALSKKEQATDLLFSISLRRYSPATFKSEDKKAVHISSQTSSESSEEAVLVSSADAEDAGDAPRYRTRSTRSTNSVTEA